MVTGKFIENPKTPRKCVLINFESNKTSNNVSSMEIYEDFEDILPQILDQILGRIANWTITFTPRENIVELILQLNSSKYSVSIKKKTLNLKQKDLDSILKYFVTKNFIESYEYKNMTPNLIELKIVYNSAFKPEQSYKSMLTNFISDPRNIILFANISSTIGKQVSIIKYNINGSESIFVIKLG